VDAEAAPLTIERLKKRPEFLAAAQARSTPKGAVLIQARRRGDDDPLVRVGFTATRKIGGAVTRNRAKRRLREAARALLPLYGRPGHDYVLIARRGVTTRPWARLLDDVKSALISLAPT
jgi:ribonuclease P protein component